VLVAGLCLTWAASGHSRVGGEAGLAMTLDTVHLLAMAAWLGGLAVLFGCVLNAGRDNFVASAAQVLPRFSRLAMACVGTLVVTGSYQTWRELRGTGIGSGSGYTRLLVFKVAVFGLLLCLGAASRSLVARRYDVRISQLGTVPAAEKGGRKRRGGQSQRDLAALGMLRRSVLLEVGIAVTVLALTAGLVATSPSGHHDEATAGGYTGPFSAQLTLSGGGAVAVWIDPARPGQNEIVIDVRDAAGKARDVPEVQARLSQPALGADPMTVPMTRTGPGQFVGRAVQLPAAGTWKLEVRVRTTEIDVETATTSVNLA
jgi:copper transport protein